MNEALRLLCYTIPNTSLEVPKVCNIYTVHVWLEVCHEHTGSPVQMSVSYSHFSFRQTHPAFCPPFSTSVISMPVS